MTASTLQARPVTPTGARWATIGVAAAAAFAVLLGLLHIIQPELDPTWRFVSEYALGRAGWLMTVAFLALAVACVSVVALYWGQARTVVGRIGVALAGLSGLGLLIAAVFPTDPITTAPQDATLNGTLHLVGGQLNLTPFAILLITIGLGRFVVWHAVRGRLWVIVALALAAAIGFTSTAAASAGAFGPGVYTGLFGRIMLLAFAIWVIVAGLHARRLARDAGSARLS